MGDATEPDFVRSRRFLLGELLVYRMHCVHMDLVWRTDIDISCDEAVMKWDFLRAWRDIYVREAHRDDADQIKKLRDYFRMIADLSLIQMNPESRNEICQRSLVIDKAVEALDFNVVGKLVEENGVLSNSENIGKWREWLA